MKSVKQLVEVVVSERRRTGRKVVRDWKCQECGKLMTAKQAEAAAFAEGCPRCDGSDVDLA